MKKLPILSYKQIVRILKNKGFTYAPKRGKGSHIAMYKVDEKGQKFLVIIPRKKQIPVGTLLSILKQAGLSKEEFMKAL